MSGKVWVLAEQWRGQLSEIAFEALALGREVADGLGTELEAVLMGSGIRNLAGSLGKADRVLCADHPRLLDPDAELYASVLADMVEQLHPRALLIPLTNVSLGMGTLLGARLRIPSVNFCRDLKAGDGRIEAHCVLYGGKIEAKVEPSSVPAILGIWAGARAPDKGRSDRVVPVEDVSVSVPAAARVRLKRYIEPERGDVDITREEVLVAVGRGIQSADNLGLAEELAAALHGAVCASRPVIDQGWLPLSRQVGKSGHTVRPKLYIALGISGAPEHTEGMKDAATIVAVNSDPLAPIFQVAHYGIVADAIDILPAMTEAVSRRRSATHA
jgi:electron transfer flavoprotein alpha subunit